MNCKYWKDSGNPRKPICTAGNSVIGTRPHIGVCMACKGKPKKGMYIIKPSCQFQHRTGETVHGKKYGCKREKIICTSPLAKAVKGYAEAINTFGSFPPFHTVNKCDEKNCKFR